MIEFIYGVVCYMKAGINKKAITVEYYNLCTYVDVDGKNNTKTLANLDIGELLDFLSKTDVQKRKIDYNGESIVLSDINYNNETELWELVFFKSRSSTIPFITDGFGKSRKIVLNDDETISEVLCVEYDSYKKVLAMQRNVYAFGTRGLESFFSYFVKKQISLVSIQNVAKKSFIKGYKLKKIRIHIKKPLGNNSNDECNKLYNKNTSICRVLDAALAVNSSIIDIKFSVANSSKFIKIESDDYDIFEDLANNSDVKNLELGFAPDEKSSMQITDYMDLRIHDTIFLPFVKGEPLNVSELLKCIATKYKENIYFK